MTRVPVGDNPPAGAYPAASEMELPLCRADHPKLEDETAEWREVWEFGLRYCVPGSWRRHSPYEWEGDEALLWFGDLNDRTQPLLSSRSVSQWRRVDRTEIGGVIAEMYEWRNEDLRERAYGTDARWTDARVLFRGTASSRAGIRLMQLVFYTVRFDRQM